MKKTNNFYSLLALLLLSSFELNAWTFTWTGTNSSSWTDAGNWNQSGTNTGANTIPGSADDVVINNAFAPAVVISSNVTILNLSQSAGIFNLSGNDLNIDNNASFTGGTLLNGWVNVANITNMQNTRFDANGGVFIINKTGGSNNDLAGNNTFAGPIAILNSSASRFRLSVTNPDIHSGFIHYEERSSGDLEPAYNGVNIYPSDMGSSGSANTVSIGMGNGTAVLNGYTTLYGDKIYFNRLIVNTNQNFSTLESLTVNSLRILSGIIDVQGNTLTVSNGSILGGSFDDGTIAFTNLDSMQNASFNDFSIIKLTGGNDNFEAGGNSYSGTVTFRNNSDKIFRLSSTIGDDYNGNIVFLEMGSGNLEPAYSGSSTFGSQINTSGSSNAIEFGAGGGWVVIDGNYTQSIIGNAGTAPVINKLRLNTTGSYSSAGMPLIIGTQIDFLNGVIVSSNTYPVIFNDNSTILTAASNQSHVNGPVVKIGNDAFSFPVGNGLISAPISISAPSSSTDQFTAQYFGTVYTSTTVNTSLDHVSVQEYWILNRTFGFSNVQVKLSFNTARSGGVNNLSDLRVARFNGTTWESTGNASTTGNTTVGTVESNSVVSNFSPFTLGSTSSLNPLPVSLISFNAIKSNDNVLVKWATSNESNNDYFTVEKSYDGKVWTNIGILNGAENSNSVINYELLDINASAGVQYYRLKQTDLTNVNSYSNVISINFANEINNLIKLFPQPVSGVLNITVPNNESDNASVSVFNAMGKKLMSFENLDGLDFQINFSDLLQGVYYIEVNVDGVISQSKIIKQ
jgi:hypothetical protein